MRIRSRRHSEVLEHSVFDVMRLALLIEGHEDDGLGRLEGEQTAMHIISFTQRQRLIFNIL